MNLLSYVSWLPSVEKRKLFLLILSSDSDLGKLSISPLPSASDISFCLLFFLLFLLSLALFELNFDASEELSKSSPNPPTPLKSLDATDAAATAAVACQVTKRGILSRPKMSCFIGFYQLFLLSPWQYCWLYSPEYANIHEQFQLKISSSSFSSMSYLKHQLQQNISITIA